VSEHADNIEAAVRNHAERIMNAAGSSLRNYSVYGTQERILAAVIDCYDEAYRAGADLALKHRQHSPAKDD
jgi:hypothetical protein